MELAVCVVREDECAWASNDGIGVRRYAWPGLLGFRRATDTSEVWRIHLRERASGANGTHRTRSEGRAQARGTSVHHAGRQRVPIEFAVTINNLAEVQCTGDFLYIQ